jgi:hypothetical protein
MVMMTACHCNTIGNTLFSAPSNKLFIYGGVWFKNSEQCPHHPLPLWFGIEDKKEGFHLHTISVKRPGLATSQSPKKREFFLSDGLIVLVGHCCPWYHSTAWISRTATSHGCWMMCSPDTPLRATFGEMAGGLQGGKAARLVETNHNGGSDGLLQIQALFS